MNNLAHQENILIFQNKISRFYDTMAETYDDVLSDAGCIVENKFIKRALGKMLDTPVIDIGTGTGLFFDLFPDVEGEGYDLSRGMLEIARHKHPERMFYQADMRQHEGGDFFTAVSLFGSLCYISAAEMEDLLFRSLVPGGQFLIMLYSDQHEYLKYRPEEIDEARVKYKKADIFDVFADRFVDIRVKGAFSLPRFSLFFSILESATLGKAFPDLCRYHIVTGRKPSCRCGK